MKTLILSVVTSMLACAAPTAWCMLPPAEQAKAAYEEGLKLLDELAKWIEERTQIAAATAALTRKNAATGWGSP